MKKKILFSALLAAASLSAFAGAACSCGGNDEEKTAEQTVYEGTMLYNGFDTVSDMYAVNQLYTWNYSPLGKLEIVNAAKFAELSAIKDGETGKKAEDLAPRQGEGALRVYYDSGTFTEILARFDRSALAGLPVDELGKLSVQVYNDSAEEKKVTLSLMGDKNKTLELENGEFTLNPYAWTECSVDFDPVITDYFKKELIGINVRFNDVTDSVYYIDDMKITFGKIYTDEINERLKKVETLEKDIDEQLSDKTITADDKETILTLYKSYAELPQAYRAIVENADTLFDAVDAYFAAVNSAESADGRMTAVFADSELGLRHFADFDGGTISYAAEESYFGETGAVKIDFNGSTDFTTIDFTPAIASGYDEFRIRIKNDSDKKRAIYFNWKTFELKAEKDSGGEADVLSGCIVPKNSGWIELVFTSHVTITQINASSVNESDNKAIGSEGTLYIGKSYAISHANDVLNAIEALKDYSSAYTAADKAAVVSAREDYDALCIASQDKITNLSKLEKIEAEIWKEGFKLLPASAEEITEYNANYKAAVDSLSAEYKKLSSGVKKLVVEEAKLLEEFEVKILQYRRDYVKDLINGSTVKSDYTTYTATELKNIRLAESCYAELDDDEKNAIKDVKGKLDSLIAATSKCYTLKDLGGDFVSDRTNVPGWGAYSGNLVNEKEGMIVFDVKGVLAAGQAGADGALYMTLFHDGSRNKGQAADGIYCILNSKASPNRIVFPNGGNVTVAMNDVDLETTYTVYYSYKVADDDSSVTINVKITDSNGNAVTTESKDVTVREFAAADFGTNSLGDWLKGAGRKTFYINAGNSAGLNILSAW